MKKTLLIMGCTLFLLVMMLVVTTAMASAQTGSPIATAAELQAIGTSPASLAGDYYLANDIDCSSISNFDPIGGWGTEFTGSIDGNGYIITNLTINRPAEDYVGLFGRTSGAVIENVALENVNVVGKEFVGGLAGSLFNGSCNNCYVSGGIQGSRYVGGLTGYNWNSSLSKCYALGEVNGTVDHVGGLVGQCGGPISDCYAISAVSGFQTVGGLIGKCGDDISNCFATGGVYGDDYVGGLVGSITSNTISNCYAVSGVFGNAFVGGLVGENEMGMGTISNSYWAGNQSTSVGGTKETNPISFFSPSHPVYTTWDFTNTWGMADGSSHPYLGNPGLAAPVFEIWTIVFVSIGMIGIIAFIWYRRRKVSIATA